MSAIYRTISQAREVAESLHPSWKHSQICQRMGIGMTLYNEIRSYDPVTVSERLSIEDEKSLREFIESCKGVVLPIGKNNSEPTPAIQPNKDPAPPEWKNPFPESPLMKALDRLGDAADQLKAMGYDVEITVTKTRDQ